MSGRDIVAYFAGHLAHVVNGNDQLDDEVETLEIKPFRLYERIRRALAHNESYSQRLVGLWAYQSRLDREEAADFYFETVLDRPVGRRAERASSTDRLHEMILSRAIGPRPLVGPDELSIWKALVGGPARRRRFRPKPEVFELSNAILKCLDAANRPYAEVLRLGLCPKDWLGAEDAVPTNTLKAANAFLAALRAAMGGEVGRRAAAQELEEAFARAPVPGFADGAAFARSALGAAILSRLAGEAHIAHVPIEVLDWAPTDDGAADALELMSVSEAAPVLDEAVAADALSLDERDLLARILAGEAIATILRDKPGLRRAIKSDHGGDVESFVADLSTRMAHFVKGEVVPDRKSR